MNKNIISATIMLNIFGNEYVTWKHIQKKTQDSNIVYNGYQHIFGENMVLILTTLLNIINKCDVIWPINDYDLMLSHFDKFTDCAITKHWRWSIRKSVVLFVNNCQLIVCRS